MKRDIALEIKVCNIIIEYCKGKCEECFIEMEQQEMRLEREISEAEREDCFARRFFAKYDYRFWDGRRTEEYLKRKNLELQLKTST